MVFAFLPWANLINFWSSVSLSFSFSRTLSIWFLSVRSSTIHPISTLFALLSFLFVPSRQFSGETFPVRVERMIHLFPLRVVPMSILARSSRTWKTRTDRRAPYSWSTKTVTPRRNLVTFSPLKPELCISNSIRVGLIRPLRSFVTLNEILASPPT